MPQASLSKDPLAPRYDTDITFELKERYKAAEKNQQKWTDCAKEDYKFALGKQWTDEELTKLKEQGRPALTFNRIKPLIDLISGYQRENSSRIKANPEGGEDRIFSEVMDKTIKYIDKISHFNYKASYWFDDGIRVGKGWLEALVTYESDPIRGELRFLQRTPYQILVDPEFNEYDLNEFPRAQYVFKIVRLSKDVLKMLYPNKKTLIGGFLKDNDDPVLNGAGLLVEGDNDDYGNNPNQTTVISHKGMYSGDGSDLERDQMFTVKEYWRPKMVERFYVIDVETGEPRKFDDKGAAEAFVNEQKSGEVVSRETPEMWVAAYTAGYVIDDSRSPFEPEYSGFPFFRFMADWAPSAENEEDKVMGITRQLKDPQREKNKAKSQILHIINTQANSGWVGDEEALTKPGWARLEKMGSKPGITVQKKRGTELREILPKGPNIGHIRIEEKADEEFKQISAINPDLIGFQEKTASGRAISLRIQQAIMSLVRLFANYRYSKEIVGKFMLEMIPKLFDEKKIMKIIGPRYMQAVKDELYPNGLSQGNIKAFLTMIKDNKYDVFVSEADQNKTIRYETFQDLVELRKAGAAVPVDLILDYMDIQNSQEVKNRIKEEEARQIQLAQVAGQQPKR